MSKIFDEMGIFLKSTNIFLLIKHFIMKKTLFLAVIFCLLASASPVSAQLIIRNNGHAEVGVYPSCF